MKLFYSEEEAIDNKLINTISQEVFYSTYIFDFSRGSPHNHSDIYQMRVLYRRHEMLYAGKAFGFYILEGFEEAATEIILKNFSAVYKIKEVR